MKNTIILTVLFLLVTSVNAADLPKEIDDNLLKVKAVEAMRSEFKDDYYNIEDLLVKRVYVSGNEMAVGINNLWVYKNKCRSLLIVADSKECSTVATCKLKSILVDCSQLESTLNNLFGL